MNSHSFETPGQIFARLAVKHGFPDLLRQAEEFIQREKTIAQAYSMEISELKNQIDQNIERAEERIARNEEQAAIRREALDDGLTTGQRAIAALERKERFSGEHECARAHLRDLKSNLGIFRRESQG